MSGVEAPLVTVVVPARDEERDLPRALAAISAQDHPRERMQVLVVDGASQDATATIAARMLETAGFEEGRVLENPEGSTPGSLNLGLAVARGDYLCRVDARSVIPPDYVRRCIEVLQTRPGVAVVGGAQRAIARGPDAISQGIARALNNRFFAGLARYRRGGTRGPTDTVYLGTFRTADVRALAGWDQALTTNQDFDLNRRMSARGSVWYEASLEVGYLPRATIPALARQYYRFGRWKVRYWRLTDDPPRPRQVVLLAIPPLAAVAATVLASRSRSRARLGMGLGAVAGALVAEIAGSRDPRASPAAHAFALCAGATVGTAWSVGVWRELIWRR